MIVQGVSGGEERWRACDANHAKRMQIRRRHASERQQFSKYFTLYFVSKLLENKIKIVVMIAALNTSRILRELCNCLIPVSI
jgi:hypothetical protein